MGYDYFYEEQSEQFAFYRTPKILFTDPKFKTMTPLAKMLYGLLLDRVSLSARNKWIDERRRVFIYATNLSIRKALNLSDKTATKLLCELEQFGLIERKRQGQGKPTRIYVMNFIESENLRFLNRINSDSGIGKITNPGSEKLRCNNTELNKHKINDTNLISSADEKRREERDQYRIYFMKSLEIMTMEERYPYDRETIREILELLIDTVCSTRKTIGIAGEQRPIEVVKSRFMKLDSGHLEFVLKGMDDNTTRIRNMKQYLLAALYNAPLTINNYYKSLVAHDMATGKI